MHFVPSCLEIFGDRLPKPTEELPIFPFSFLFFGRCDDSNTQAVGNDHYDLLKTSQKPSFREVTSTAVAVFSPLRKSFK